MSPPATSVHTGLASGVAPWATARRALSGHWAGSAWATPNSSTRAPAERADGGRDVADAQERESVAVLREVTRQRRRVLDGLEPVAERRPVGVDGLEDRVGVARDEGQRLVRAGAVLQQVDVREADLRLPGPEVRDRDDGDVGKLRRDGGRRR